MSTESRPCPDCGATPGQLHNTGCDVERCHECGGQRISCDCDTVSPRQLPWTGEWPGNEAAARLGLWTRWTELGWKECGNDHPDARPDLNRLAVLGIWDAEKGDWVGIKAR